MIIMEPHDWVYFMAAASSIALTIAEVVGIRRRRGRLGVDVYDMWRRCTSIAASSWLVIIYAVTALGLLPHGLGLMLISPGVILLETLRAYYIIVER